MDAARRCLSACRRRAPALRIERDICAIFFSCALVSIPTMRPNKPNRTESLNHHHSGCDTAIHTAVRSRRKKQQSTNLGRQAAVCCASQQLRRRVATDESECGCRRGAVRRAAPHIAGPAPSIGFTFAQRRAFSPSRHAKLSLSHQIPRVAFFSGPTPHHTMARSLLVLGLVALLAVGAAAQNCTPKCSSNGACTQVRATGVGDGGQVAAF